MGIFNGSESLFYILGALTLALVFGLIYMHKIYNFKWYATLLAALGIFQTIFTIAWWISSIQEGEPQAGNMGLLTFGVPALLLFGFAQRLISKKKAEIIVAEEPEAETP
jgi:hypothetical protein